MPVIGHVIQQGDGSYRGELKTLTIKAPLEFRPNKEKKNTAHADFFVFSENLELGAAWWRDAEGSLEQQVFVSIAAPEFGRRRLLRTWRLCLSVAVIAPSRCCGIPKP